MDDELEWRLLLPAPVRRLPADLAAIVALVILVFGAVYLPVVNETPIRVVVGLAFVLFAPGYGLVAALFPEGDESAPSGTAAAEGVVDAEGEGHIDYVERIALAFGTSIALVPLVGLALNFTPWGIRLTPIIVSLAALTLGLVAIAARRRDALPPESRFQVPYRRWAKSARAEFFRPETRTDAALNVALVASLLLAVGSVGYAVAAPMSGEQFTEFYLLTENENGELVADDYPTEFTRGESESLVVGIQNQEGETVRYTVVVELHRMSGNGTSARVTQERELRRFHTRLAANETWRLSHELAPTMTGKNLRLTYLLYKGSAPPQPSFENAYREVHLWVNVTQSGQSMPTTLEPPSSAKPSFAEPAGGSRGSPA